MDNKSPDATATMYLKGKEGFCFVNALDYRYSGGGFGNIIIKIPKTGIGKHATTAIWGLIDDSPHRQHKAFLLPKYIYGFVENNMFVDYGNYKIERNPHQDENTYPFYAMDKSYIPSMPAMEHEQLSEEIVGR